jgi:hypothetical protein
MSELDDLFDEIQGKDTLTEREKSTEEQEFEDICQRLEKKTEEFGTWICLPDTSKKVLSHTVVRLKDATDEQVEKWVQTYCPHLGVTQDISSIERKSLFHLVTIKNSSLKIPIGGSEEK